MPGSKSLTNRGLVLAAGRIGITAITNGLHSDDTRHLANSLNAFQGLAVVETAAGFQVERSRADLAAPAEPVFLGGAATPARLMLAFAAGVDGATTVTGNPRLSERPMGDILRAFDGMGVRYECLGAPDCLPVRVWGGSPLGAEWSVDGGVSSQFTTALLLLAARQAAPVRLRITGHQVSRPYVAMTLKLLRDCGAQIVTDDLRDFAVTPGALDAAIVPIESDASAASYLLAAAALSGSSVEIPGLGRQSAQGDVGFARVLAAMGCAVDVAADAIRLRGGNPRGVDVDMEAMPDVVLTLAALAAVADGPTTIRNIANLRLKECDRIAAAAAELTRFGAAVEEGADWLRIMPAPRLRPARIRTYDDHRVAMSFALLQLRCPDIEIEDPDCVSKSFPGFWDELSRFRTYLAATAAS